jgi:uncharacterized delta-60 repeat protein
MRRHPVALTLALVAGLGSSAAAAPGDLDPSFGTGGTANVPVGQTWDGAHAVAIQPDGKIVLAGEATTVVDRMAVVRLLPEGALDTTFNFTGIKTLNAPRPDASAEAVAVAPDGKIVVAGNSWDSATSRYLFTVARLRANGFDDFTFSGDGMATTIVGDGTTPYRGGFATGVAVQPDGRVVAVGFGDEAGYAASDRLVIVRYTVDGLLDPTFGGGTGIVTPAIPNSSFSMGQAVALQPDGKIVALAHGFITPGPGQTRSDLIAVRLAPDGTPDPTFGVGGTATARFDWHARATALALQPDGKIVVGGYVTADTEGRFALARFDASGVLDPTFAGGTVVTSFGGYADFLQGLAVLPDGRILAAGWMMHIQSHDTDDLALARYRPDGTPDATFGGEGRVVTPVGPRGDLGYGLALQADGKAVVAARAYFERPPSGSNDDFTAVRYLADPPAVCGNGTVEHPETCDDGNTSAGDCCSGACELEPAGAPCADDGSVCTIDACTGAGACAHAAGNAGTPCRPAAGSCDAAETCDGVAPACPADAHVPDGTACTGDPCAHPTCQAGTCTPGPTTPVCGDGVVCGAEQCDDGNGASGDGCDAGCIPTACGNGVLTVGEQCDDANLVAGDGCAAGCTYELVPGNGGGTVASNARACLLEFSVVNPHNVPFLDGNGRPHHTQKCWDGDPTCDRDPASGSCTFEVAVCLNNVDPNLPTCPARGVSTVTVTKPTQANDPATRATLLSALTSLRNPAMGVTGLQPPVAVGDRNFCSAPFAVRVPLRGPNRQGSKDLCTSTTSLQPAGTTDTDCLTLVCKP